jgi:hypothetical protein
MVKFVQIDFKRAESKSTLNLSADLVSSGSGAGEATNQ